MALRPTISSVLALVIWSSVAATGEKSTFPITSPSRLAMDHFPPWSRLQRSSTSRKSASGPIPAWSPPSLSTRDVGAPLGPGQSSGAGRSGDRLPANVFKPIAPLLILIGELDDWTPAEPSRKLAAGYPVEIKVYPGAHHSFDSILPVRHVADRINAHSATGRG